MQVFKKAAYTRLQNGNLNINNMSTKEQIENIVFHQTKCLNALEDMRKLIETHHEDSAINKLKDVESELTRLTKKLRAIEDQV